MVMAWPHHPVVKTHWTLPANAGHVAGLLMAHRDALCVRIAVPGWHGVTISTELPKAFPAPSLMCLQNTYVGSALFSFLGAHCYLL